MMLRGVVMTYDRYVSTPIKLKEFFPMYGGLVLFRSII